MKILAEKETRHFFLAMAGIMAGFGLLFQLGAWVVYGGGALWMLPLFLLMAGGILAVGFWYVAKQNKIMAQAASKVNAYLDGNSNARIDCDREGEMYRLFHRVNTLASVLNAHAQKELAAKESLKSTISDISHQLKTPLAALNIYNSLLQEEAKDFPVIEEYAALSERELDRMEMLIQNLLKIARLDAGSIVFEKKVENVADMMKDIELHFSCRAKEEQKEMILAGSDEVSLFCDRVWLMEAVSNVVKNAFDHTGAGGCILIEWKAFISLVQITVKDNGCGIHPEDLYHIFKRFYRSRFSKDTQGAGLGLPLAKAIVEAHDGTIEVKSRLGAETCFTINFLTGP